MSLRPEKFFGATEEVVDTGREKDSTFAEGNPGGPGSPFARISEMEKPFYGAHHAGSFREPL